MFSRTKLELMCLCAYITTLSLFACLFACVFNFMDSEQIEKIVETLENNFEANEEESSASTLFVGFRQSVSVVY